jgi:1,4-alpha-glucan branching enzyme
MHAGWTAIVAAAGLRTVAATRAGGADLRAARELLALQASDWAFLVSRDLAEPYGRERAAGHRAALDAALRAPGAHDPAVRNLAADASLAALREP